MHAPSEETAVSARVADLASVEGGLILVGALRAGPRLRHRSDCARREHKETCSNTSIEAGQRAVRTDFGGLGVPLHALQNSLDGLQIGRRRKLQRNARLSTEQHAAAQCRWRARLTSQNAPSAVLANPSFSSKVRARGKGSILGPRATLLSLRNLASEGCAAMLLSSFATTSHVLRRACRAGPKTNERSA